MKAGRLELVIEIALTTGLLVSALLLLAGLTLSLPKALYWGIVILMLTPVVRVIILTLGLFQQRDFAFGAISLVILAVLASSLWTAFQFAAERRQKAPAAAHAP